MARARVAVCVLVAAVASALAAAPAASAADAVVLVSGFTSANPFTTSAPECAGMEGEAWATIAPTLKAAGLTVFTAPEGPGAAPPAPCSGGGPLPPSDAFLDTQGDLDTNGRALARFVAFLRDAYGVTSVQFVGHSDGGLWSRSAIAQAGAYAGVRILSLNTVASPHTGSFVADAAMLAQSIDCAVPDRRTAQACRSLTSAARLISTLGGPTAIAELTYTYMGTWAARQPFGGCPVTVLNGTAFAVPGPVSQVPRYYNPSDGVVGQASALAQPSRSQAGGIIPAPEFRRLLVGGSYDAVHTGVLSFAGQPTELSLQPLADRLLTAVRDGAQSTETCNGAPAPGGADEPVKYGWRCARSGRRRVPVGCRPSRPETSSAARAGCRRAAAPGRCSATTRRGSHSSSSRGSGAARGRSR